MLFARKDKNNNIITGLHIVPGTIYRYVNILMDAFK